MKEKKIVLDCPGLSFKLKLTDAYAECGHEKGILIDRNFRDGTWAGGVLPFRRIPALIKFLEKSLKSNKP